MAELFEYEMVLCPELGQLFYILYDEVCLLCAKWSQYQALFDQSAERVAVLNSVARSLFYIVQDVLFEHVVLQIARLKR